MPTTLNDSAYRDLLREDIVWLKTVKRTLEQDHILLLLEYEYEHLAMQRHGTETKQVAIVDPGGYRCFHCKEVFFDEDKAREHFGAGQTQQPACQIDATEYRRMEEVVFQYENEDTELHRHIAILKSDLAVKVRRAEEDGYARGLADAKKHPGELGLTEAPTNETEL